MQKIISIQASQAIWGMGLLLLASGLSLLGDVASGHRGVVASVHPLASQYGLAQLQAGGNAIDAAVATGLMLGVVDGHNSGLGGGCFILLHTASGEIAAVDGREMAPARAHRDLYLKDGEYQPEWSQTGPLAVGVPGALAAFDAVLTRFGTKPLAHLLEGAAKQAEAGFPVTPGYHATLTSQQETLARFPASRAQFLDSEGKPWKIGCRLIQADLAQTYRSIAEHGTDWFYQGEFARRVGTWMKENGGILEEQDFRNYRVKWRSPVSTRFRDYTILGFPPPSSGGTHVAQILNILENFPPGESRQPQSTLWIHRVTEAMKLAFADRAFWLGDSDFVKVPKGLTEPSYARTLFQRIDDQKALVVTGHSTPELPEAPTGHTTHFTAADAAGNWVAITATINTSFGSKVVVPGTGVVLNNEMDDFTAQPGKPNFFGLLGAEANSIQPGKRPLSSMSPTLVLKNNQPFLTVGGAGGPTIISQTVLHLLNILDRNLSLEEALEEPRFHHQWQPDQVFIESSLPQTVVQQLKEKGHKPQMTRGIGISQGIIQAADGLFIGVSDPRAGGQACAW